jgi:hypothetical protein
MLLRKMKEASGDEFNKLKSSADAHSVFLFENGFDYDNPPSYGDNHTVDPKCMPEKPSSANFMESWLGRQTKDLDPVVGGRPVDPTSDDSEESTEGLKAAHYTSDSDDSSFVETAQEDVEARDVDNVSNSSGLDINENITTNRNKPDQVQSGRTGN